MSGAYPINTVNTAFIPPLEEKANQPDSLIGYVGTLTAVGTMVPTLDQDKEALRYPAGEKKAYLDTLISNPQLFQKQPDTVSEADEETLISDSESIASSLRFEEESKAEYAFAAYDRACELVNEENWKKLPYFDECCEAVPNLVNNLEKLKVGLASIEKSFKDESLFQSEIEDEVDEVLQVRLDKLITIQDALKALMPTVKALAKAKQHLEKSKLPTEKQSHVVKMMTNAVTGIGSILIFYGIPASWLSLLSNAANSILDRRSYLIQQKIKLWEDFKEALDALDQHNPSKEGNMSATLKSVSREYHNVREGQNQIITEQEAQAQELKDAKQKLENVTDALKKSEEARVQESEQNRKQILELRNAVAEMQRMLQNQSGLQLIGGLTKIQGSANQGRDLSSWKDVA